MCVSVCACVCVCLCPCVRVCVCVRVYACVCLGGGAVQAEQPGETGADAVLQNGRGGGHGHLRQPGNLHPSLSPIASTIKRLCCYHYRGTTFTVARQNKSVEPFSRHLKPRVW